MASKSNISDIRKLLTTDEFDKFATVQLSIRSSRGADIATATYSPTASAFTIYTYACGEPPLGYNVFNPAAFGDYAPEYSAMSPYAHFSASEWRAALRDIQEFGRLAREFATR